MVKRWTPGYPGSFGVILERNTMRINKTLALGMGAGLLAAGVAATAAGPKFINVLTGGQSGGG